MPTLHEFDVLFGSLPELPLPQPRKRDTPLSANPVKRLNGLDEKATPSNLLSAPATRPSFPWLPTFLRKFFGAAPSASLAAPARTNPFMALKQGRKIIVVAVVDAGSVGFFRFGQGCFEEWPMA
jgi:tRNA-splicing endonuclease subunit Sen54